MECPKYTPNVIPVHFQPGIRCNIAGICVLLFENWPQLEKMILEAYNTQYTAMQDRGWIWSQTPKRSFVECKSCFWFHYMSMHRRPIASRAACFREIAGSNIQVLSIFILCLCHIRYSRHTQHKRRFIFIYRARLILLSNGDKAYCPTLSLSFP